MLVPPPPYIFQSRDRFVTVKSAPYFYLACDYPGCDSESREYGDHGQGTLFDTEADAAKEFERKWEGGVADDYGWIFHDGRHYCCDHTEWNDDEDERVPAWYCTRCDGPCGRHRPERTPILSSKGADWCPTC